MSADRSVAASQWRPIGTAPKDGTRVLLTENNGQPIVAYWGSATEDEGHPDWRRKTWRVSWDGCALGDDCGGFDWWMPAPIPPTNEGPVVVAHHPSPRRPS